MKCNSRYEVAGLQFTATRSRSERGIALVTALLLLILLSALAFGLVYLTNTETLVNGNFRNVQVAEFAARAGMEEARDRMSAGAGAAPTGISALLPTQPPSGTNSGILYIVNEGSNPGTVQPWTPGNQYQDDELCHDGYNIPGLQAQASVAPGIRCSGPPTPSPGAWYVTPAVASTAPLSGTSAAMAYKWVRIAMKLNSSVQNYMVNSAAATNTPVCWTGASEEVLTAADCAHMAPTANPVYMVTSLAVAPNGARRIVQAELALNPGQPLPYGLFATGTGCGAITLSGGSTTDSFTSAGGGTYSTTKSLTGGDIGSNGNVSLSGNPTQVGGSIGEPGNPAPAAGPCPGSGLSTNGGAGMIPNPANVLQTNQPPCAPAPCQSIVTAPTPPPPNPLPPTTNVNYTKSKSLSPGTYGNVSVSGHSTLTLAPGIYNLDGLSLSGNSTVVISPPGQIILNLNPNNSNPLDFSGGSLSNTTDLASNFQINYGGTGTIKVSGGSDSYFIVNAPNAAVSLTGHADIYGAILGNTIDDSGGTAFHYDKSISLVNTSAAYLNLISQRDVPY